MPDIPVLSIVVDPSNRSRLYVGTDLGVFTSTDCGATCAVENTGFANVITEALALNTFGGTTSLFAFTHGRGAWRVPLATATTSCPTVSINSLSPESGSVGAGVTITGTGFSGVTGVKFANNM